ncbi:unnamed protein product [Fraxinus pennsylvanica]|uniref:Uncharacterized protein n=1 Tax=Fraxinus pennsylvanica TaxID=56036 RepID=A0AAD2AGI0_9LAMI|nr:unnamed protein product [Fraxinus pennsylvanica]
MEKGKRQKPINLIELLHKSNNFNGVREFDNNRVPSLHSHEPPNSWSLPVVTLTCIAIALPNISNDNANQLVRCVGEGLALLKRIEKSLDKNGALSIIRNAADVVWVGVDLYCKWQDKDLRKASLRGRTSKETLELLSNEAERTVKQFIGEVNDFLMDNPLNWPVKIIAANSMLEILQKQVKNRDLLDSKTCGLRESSLPLQVRHRKWKKFLHAKRRLVLNCYLGVQILLVWAGKLVLLISASFFHHIKKLKIFVIGASNNGGLESGGDALLDLTRYVLLLQGEPGIPKETLKNIWNEVDKMMEKGKRQKPIILIELLHKCNNFNGVRDFDNIRVPSLHSQEPPNSWSLPVVTLTCIAIALPNISNDNGNQLVTCVREGLSFLKLMEKSLDKNGALAIIRNAADVVWVGVNVYCKW